MDIIHMFFFFLANSSDHKAFLDADNTEKNSWKLYQFFFVMMLFSASYRKAKHYLKDENISSPSSPRVDLVSGQRFGIFALLCVFLSIFQDGFLAPSTTSLHEAISLGGKGKRRLFLTAPAFDWRQIISRSLLGQHSFRSHWPMSMSITPTVQGSQWFTTVTMIHLQRQVHRHLNKNRICLNRGKKRIYLVESSNRVCHKRNPHGPSMSLMVLVSCQLLWLLHFIPP